VDEREAKRIYCKAKTIATQADDDNKEIYFCTIAITVEHKLV
jgi:hypothetical protein